MKALQWFEKALELNLKDADVWQHKCSTLEKLGRRDEAKECKDVIEKNKLNPIPQV